VKTANILPKRLIRTKSRTGSVRCACLSMRVICFERESFMRISKFNSSYLRPIAVSADNTELILILPVKIQDMHAYFWCDGCIATWRHSGTENSPDPLSPTAKRKAFKINPLDFFLKYSSRRLCDFKLTSIRFFTLLSAQREDDTTTPIPLLLLPAHSSYILLLLVLLPLLLYSDFSDR
jgi:hypothetical protein